MSHRSHARQRVLVLLALSAASLTASRAEQPGGELKPRVTITAAPERSVLPKATLDRQEVARRMQRLIDEAVLLAAHLPSSGGQGGFGIGMGMSCICAINRGGGPHKPDPDPGPVIRLRPESAVAFERFLQAATLVQRNGMNGRETPVVQAHSVHEPSPSTTGRATDLGR